MHGNCIQKIVWQSYKQNTVRGIGYSLLFCFLHYPFFPITLVKCLAWLSNWAVIWESEASRGGNLLSWIPGWPLLETEKPDRCRQADFKLSHHASGQDRQEFQGRLNWLVVGGTRWLIRELQTAASFLNTWSLQIFGPSSYLSSPLPLETGVQSRA